MEKTNPIREAQRPARPGAHSEVRGPLELPPFNPGEVRALLLSAYDAGKRNLPWREESDPYRIWVSEVMLQQTRVETVIPYYERWLEQFPDIDALAEAEEDEVLRAWQGLGYYSRARRLREGAILVRERFGGVLPGNSGELREIPGIGAYTAGAMASIAFGEVVPAVDGNVRRVLTRLFDLSNPSPTELGILARELVDPERPGDFNQALMELGALVCMPRSPRCVACPISSECLALERGTVSERPVPRRKKTMPEADLAVLVAAARGEAGGVRFLLRKRPAEGLLAGMWEFPGVEVPAASTESRRPSLQDEVTGSSGFPPQEVAVNLATELGLVRSSDNAGTDGGLTGLHVVTHVFSHLKVRYWPFLLEVASPASPRVGPGLPKWISGRRLQRIPLPVAQQKIIESARAFLDHSAQLKRSV